jgi:hypothetical protein
MLPSNLHPSKLARRALVAGAALASTLALAASPAQALDPPLAVWNEATNGLSVSGTYVPVVGDFGGAAGSVDDILWYAPGAATDHLWLSNDDTTFSKQASPNQISGTYTPIVGDFAGNGLDDIVWYAPGAGVDHLWTSNGLGWSSTALAISGTYVPSVLDDESGKDDIVWAAPNGGAGHVWSFEGGGAYLSTPITSPAGSRALVGMFGPGACADVFWYAPGGAPDALWHMNCAGTAGTIHAQTVNGHYQPAVGDFRDENNGWDDILWYRFGASSTLWSPNGDGKWNANALDIPIAATPIAAAIDWGLVHFWSPTETDVVFWAEGSGGADARLSQVVNTEIGAGAQPVVGRFVGNSADIFWYRPGAGAERMFWNLP